MAGEVSCALSSGAEGRVQPPTEFLCAPVGRSVGAGWGQIERCQAGRDQGVFREWRNVFCGAEP